MRSAAVLFLTLLATHFIAAQQQNPFDIARGDIAQVLTRQLDAWNRGDLEGYMAKYWNSPELTFYSGGTITRGWQPTLERYRRRYQGEGHAMGQLEFDDLDIVVFGPDWGMARGRWKLTMPDGKHPQGLFTVILRKFPEGWRIVHDHSSSE